MDDINESIGMPEFISEITGDTRYKNHSLAESVDIKIKEGLTL